MLKKLLIASTISLVLIVSLLVTSAQEDATPTGGRPWDLKYGEQVGQFAFYDLPAGASTTGKPLDIGDFDGDGCGDIAITGHNSAHPLGTWRGSVGHVRVVMNVCDISGQIAMAAPPQNMFTIFGAYSGDMAGTETYVADFNGDGYDDLLFSSQNSDGPNQDRSNAGAAYVLFGSANFAQHGDIDLQQLPEDIIVFYGARNEDRLGLWVEGGDFDNDGYHDVLVGANQADGEGDHRPNAGEAWIFYGGEDMVADYGQITDLREPPASATRIIGADFDDLLGSCVWGDDIDGDGYDDAIVGAGLWRASSGVGGLSFGGADGPGNQRYNSGEVFVVFGGPDLRGQVVDLQTRLDVDGRPLDDSISVVYGPDANDLFGEEIATGDVDGDGINDVVLGTLIGDGPENNMDEAGEVWVIYMNGPFRGHMIDLADPPSGRTLVIYPDQPDSKAGDTLRVDDLDGDGIDDIFYGAPDYDPIGYDGEERHNAGVLAIIYGEEGGIPHDNERILLFDPPEDLRVQFIIGADANDMMPYALAVYDVDGDGILDIAPNAMGGDGLGNAHVNAGEIYIVSGAEFLSENHAYQPDDVPPTPVNTELPPTPRPTFTPLPEATVTVTNWDGLERGQEYYEEACAGCHGFQGEGVEGLGLSLVDSPLVQYAPDLELMIFLRVGRPADHPDNQLGVSMPPSGGRPDWNNDEFADIITYLRWLRDVWSQ